MKLWTLAGLLTGVVVATLIVRHYRRSVSSIAQDPDRRYAIDDFLAPEEV